MLRQITLFTIAIFAFVGQVTAQKYKPKKIFHLEAKSARFVAVAFQVNRISSSLP
jgi:hypothetical protein